MAASVIRPSQPLWKSAAGPRLEKRKRYARVVGEGVNQDPGTAEQFECLENAGLWIHKPEMRDAFPGVRAAWSGQVEAAGGRRECLADPVRDYVEVGDVGKHGHRFASPCSNVRHEDVLAEMNRDEVRVRGG